MASSGVLENVLSIVTKNTAKPESFLSVQEKVASDLKKCTKVLYDFTKKNCGISGKALPELLIENFDEEQIWQQIELQNEPALTHSLINVSKVLAWNNELKLPISLTPQEDPETNEPISDDEQVENLQDKRKSKESDSDEDEKQISKKRKIEKKRKLPSIVDDKFFKLQELHEYLTKEEKKENVPLERDDDSDEESVDLFDDYSDEEDEEDEDNVKYVKYADFFDSPESEEEKEVKDDKKSEVVAAGDEEFEYELQPKKMLEPFKKKVKFNLTNDSDDTDSLENKEAQDAQDTEPKSTFLEREERLKKRIRELEEENLAEKPWQLKGEVSAMNRPENALLEEYLETEVTSRPPPVMTEQTTLTLEDMIKMRIRDKAFDDVEKKFKPVETPMQYKKKLILDQEKSKKSLAEIYESEYLKQKQNLDPEKKDEEPEEPKEHIKLREMMHSLFVKLDALSNFHYTPKPSKPDIKIISNLPVVSMEEVAPVATSDAMLLAPEEIKVKSRGDVIGKAERTKTDMKRSRRRKKLRQREVEKDKEARAKLPSKSGPKKKLQKEKAALTNEVAKARNVQKMVESSHKIAKSSTAFFEQLQDQVKTTIRSKTAAKSTKKKNTLSAVKLKL